MKSDNAAQVELQSNNSPYKVDVVTLISAEILAEDNSKIRIASLWQKQTIIFVFLRHFACMACRAHADQVWKNREVYEKSGAKIIFIGNGDPAMIPRFRREMGIDSALVLTDPSLVTFRAAGFRRGFFVSVGPAAIKNGLGLISQGYKQTKHSKAEGDIWQLGGVLVMTPAGRIAYHFISEATGDFPMPKDVSIAKELNAVGDYSVR